MREVLDNPSVYSEIDKNDMYSKIFNMPNDIEYVIRVMERFEVPRSITIGGRKIEYERPDNIVLCGMGGSAIGGFILKDILWDLIDIPVEVVREYTPPNYVDERSLVILVSYSGNTEETLNCLLHSLKSGAMLFAITSDGILMKIAQRLSIPYYKVPKGYPPRAAIIHLTLPALYIVSKLLNTSTHLEKIEDVVELLKELRRSIAKEVPLEENIAKVNAVKLMDVIPIIYSYRPYRSIGYRFKTQLNENCKIHAFFEELPEMNHNGIMGWSPDVKYLKELFKVVLVRGRLESIEMYHRIAFLEELLKELDIEYIDIRSSSTFLLGEVFELVMLLDMITYYLSVIRKVDPTPVFTIEKLKKYLQEKVCTSSKIQAELKSFLPL